MGKKKTMVLPSTEKALKTMGQQIKLARLRRKLDTKLVASRANISTTTLWSVENGSPSVSIGIYANVLNAIGMKDEFSKIAKDDVLGRTLQDLDISVNKRIRHSRKKQ